MIEFEKLANIFVSLADNITARTQIGLKVAAEYIKSQCEEVIGTPQTEWRPLTEATERIKESGGYPQNSPLLRTGEYKESIKTRVSPGEALIYSTVPQAAYQEYGTKWAPPRPVFLLILHRDEKFILDLIGMSIMAKAGVTRAIGSQLVTTERAILPEQIKGQFFSGAE